jgi:ketosteroid isomerase-like protein
MKLLSISTLALLGILVPLFGAAPKPADEAAVLAAERRLAEAMVKADVPAIEKLLGDDLLYTHSSGTLTETKTEVLKPIQSGSTKYESIEFKTTKVRQFGDVVVTNHVMVFIVEPHKVNNIYVTMMWQKQANGWQLVSRQATKLP